MKRKIVSALLVMSMTASLVACGNSGSGSSDPADESVSVSSSASSESDASASASSESEAEAEESEMPEGYDETSTELYNEALGDFNDALATAKEAETVDERYALMAVAEGKLMESAMMYPLTSRGGMYAMYRMAPRTKDYTLWGSDNDRYHQYVVTTDFIKAEDYNEMRAKWDELKGKMCIRDRHRHARYARNENIELRRDKVRSADRARRKILRSCHRKRCKICQ